MSGAECSAFISSGRLWHKPVSTAPPAAAAAPPASLPACADCRLWAGGGMSWAPCRAVSLLCCRCQIEALTGTRDIIQREQKQLTAELANLKALLVSHRQRALGPLRYHNPIGCESAAAAGCVAPSHRHGQAMHSQLAASRRGPGDGHACVLPTVAGRLDDTPHPSHGQQLPA